MMSETMEILYQCLISKHSTFFKASILVSCMYVTITQQNGT